MKLRGSGRLLLLGWALALGAPDPALGDSAGRVLYATYCSSCHGVEGRGNGPVADSLVVAPPDLTQLARRHGVPLPRDSIAEFIDGRADVRAHGPRDMPVWGRLFAEEADPAADLESVTRRSIDVILDYLISIQDLHGALR